MPVPKFQPITEEQMRVDLAHRLRGLRGAVALDTVARGAGVATRGYFDIERGAKSANLRTLLKLANFHSLSIKELMP